MSPVVTDYRYQCTERKVFSQFWFFVIPLPDEQNGWIHWDRREFRREAWWWEGEVSWIGCRNAMVWMTVMAIMEDEILPLLYLCPIDCHPLLSPILPWSFCYVCFVPVQLLGIIFSHLFYSGISILKISLDRSFRKLNGHAMNSS